MQYAFPGPNFQNSLFALSRVLCMSNVERAIESPFWSKRLDKIVIIQYNFP